MSAMETSGETAAIGSSDQLTQAFYDVALCTQTVYELNQQTTLAGVFDTAIKQWAVTSENAHILEIGQLVDLALNGIQARLNEQKIREIESMRVKRSGALERLLSQLRNRPVTISSLDGSNSIERIVIDPDTGSPATDGHVSVASGRISIYQPWGVGSRLYVGRDSSVFRRWHSTLFAADIFNPQTAQQLVKIEIED